MKSFARKILMKNGAPQFDMQLAHRYFAVDCFNRAWELIDKPDRTPADDEAMLLLANASLWHWTQRDDRTDRNLSVGHWQLSRINSLLGRGDDAMRHAEQSLRYAAGSPPFYIAYAHEAIARAALVEGNPSLANSHPESAETIAAGLSDPEERDPLEADLRSLALAAAACH